MSVFAFLWIIGIIWSRTE